MQLTPRVRTSMPAFAGAGPAQTRLQHCASSLNSHASGAPLSLSTLLIMRRHLDRHSLWKLLRHYNVPEKITSIIINSYSGMTCRVVCGCQLTDAFQVKTGVRQGCLWFPFLFLQAINWVLKTSTAQRGNRIWWIPWDSAWWPGLCRWSGSALPYPVTDAKRRPERLLVTEPVLVRGSIGVRARSSRTTQQSVQPQ